MARSIKEVHTINYYPINEGAARRAKEMNSFSDYKEGSATAEYRAMVDKAAAIAEKQKSRVDPMYHEKIDHLLDTYARKLAENMNQGFSMPSGVCEPEERSPCMNKIDKLDKELEKAREKAAEWQAKIRELEKQKQEEENSQIVQAVRSLKLTPAQLMAFLNDPKNSLTASGHTDPKPEAPEKEDTAHEEN